MHLIQEILYADDLVLLGDDWKEVEFHYSKWKKVLSEKGRRQEHFVHVKGLLQCIFASIHAQYVEKVLEET